MLKSKKSFYFSAYGYVPKDFKQWGKLGGRPKQYVNQAEKQKAYRRRKALAKIEKGELSGILNLTTGRINCLKPRRQIKIRDDKNKQKNI